MAELLVVRNLVRRFGDRTVLDRLSFELGTGEVCAVVGPNGAGKTTLLRCVVGADRPDHGTITLAGRDLRETDPWVRASVASVLDDVDFFPDLSVREHLDLLAFGHGTPDAAGTVERIVAELGLDVAQDQLPATLSSGQRRRAALASCFVRPRRLLVLDEPEQRLDVAGRAWLTRALLAERDAGTAVLLASHDPELIEAVADYHLEFGDIGSDDADLDAVDLGAIELGAEFDAAGSGAAGSGAAGSGDVGDVGDAAEPGEAG